MDAPARAERAARSAAIVAFGLAILKLGAGFATGSLAVMASSLDSLMDTLASGVNMLALRWSGREPTRVFAFGYGKAQALAGLLQGVFITASGLGLVWAAIERLHYPPRSLTGFSAGALVMLVTAAASAMLSIHLRRTARETSTPLLSADALHYASDLWANAGALLALVVERWARWAWFDPAISILVALWILRGALRVAASSVGELLDHGLPEEDVVKVGEVLARHAPDVRGYHDLRTRRSGHRRYFDFHVVMRPDLTFAQAHDLTERITLEVEALWPGADVTVHPDPEPDARLPYAGRG